MAKSQLVFHLYSSKMTNIFVRQLFCSSYTSWRTVFLFISMKIGRYLKFSLRLCQPLIGSRRYYVRFGIGSIQSQIKIFFSFVDLRSKLTNIWLIKNNVCYFGKEKYVFLNVKVSLANKSLRWKKLLCEVRISCWVLYPGSFFLLEICFVQCYRSVSGLARINPDLDSIPILRIQTRRFFLQKLGHFNNLLRPNYWSQCGY
mgnify:CR=1 FL=1